MPLIQAVQKGDILAMRKDYFDTHPEDPWYLFCEGIALGEKLIQGEDIYTHIAVALGYSSTVSLIKTIEDFGNGEGYSQRQLGPMFDVFRVLWVDPNHPQMFVDSLKEELGTPYDYEGLAFIALARKLNDPNLAPEERKKFVCSTIVAKKLMALGYRPWPKLTAQVITPTDYAHGLQMKMVNQKGLWLPAA